MFGDADVLVLVLAIAGVILFALVVAVLVLTIMALRVHLGRQHPDDERSTDGGTDRLP